MLRMGLAFFLVFFPFLFQAFANEECVALNVSFDSKPKLHFYKDELHFSNHININPYHSQSKIINSKSELLGRFPYTTVLMVKPTHFADDAITLQFNVVHYGFQRAGSIITQPIVVVKKGQLAQLQTSDYKLQVQANWS